ncbi:MAG: hypothetical protein ACLQDY_08550 [Streptosporangiaceae bacterium]
MYLAGPVIGALIAVGFAMVALIAVGFAMVSRGRGGEVDRPESDRDSVLPDLAVWEVYVIYGNSAAPWSASR